MLHANRSLSRDVRFSAVRVDLSQVNVKESMVVV